MGRRHNTFAQFGYIPTIWSLSGSTKIEITDDIQPDDRTAWLVVGLDPQLAKREKREASWVILREDTKKGAMERAISEFGYSLVFAMERQEQPKGEADIFAGRNKDANNPFWLLFRKVDQLAANGHADEDIIRMIERYNPATPTLRMNHNNFTERREDLYATSG